MAIRIDNIIVEGADQQGKSQVCKKLSGLLGWPVKHYGKPDPEFDFHYDYLLEKNTISDRNFMSEMVYSLFRDQKHRVKNPVLLQKTMEHNNYLYIHVDRGDDFKFDISRNEAFDLDQIQIARKLYDAYFYAITLNKIRVNPNDLSSVIKLLKANDYL